MRTFSSLSKKIISLSLAVILALPSSVFAGELGTQQPVTRTQMAVMLSVTDEVGSFIKDNGVAIIIISALAYTANGYRKQKADNKSLMVKNIALQQKNLMSASTADKLAENLASVEKAIKSLQTENSALRQEKLLAEISAEQLTGKIQSMGRTIQSLQDEKAALLQKNLIPASSADKLKGQIESMEKTIQSLQDEKAALIAERNSLKFKVSMDDRSRQRIKDKAVINEKRAFDKGYTKATKALEPQLLESNNQILKRNQKILELEELQKMLSENPSAQIESYLDGEIKLLQQKLAARERVIGVQDDITKLVLKINTDMTALRTAKGAQASQLAASIEASVSKLAAVKVPNSTLREAVTKFLQETVRVLKGKGGILCMTALAVAGTALALLSSNETSTSIVSNSRLAVTRIMNATYTETPELLFITTQQLKKKYGDAVVVDVVYENQAKYAPLIKQQSDIFKSKNVRESARKIAQYMQPSPESNKAMLLNSLAS